MSFWSCRQRFAQSKLIVIFFLELKLKGRSNVWLEILEESLKERLGFWTRVVVLKMDFDKPAVKIFMSENEKPLNHLRLRNRNYRRYSVFEKFEESLNRKNFAHRRKLLWQLFRSVLCIRKLRVQILHIKSITLIYHNSQLDFSPCLRLWIFPRKFPRKPHTLKDFEKSIQFPAKKISKVQKLQKLFSVLNYLDTQIQILQK